MLLPGGMRAVTWTQAAQYLVLVVACIVPVAMLSYKTNRCAHSASHVRPGDAAGRTTREPDREAILSTPKCVAFP